MKGSVLVILIIAALELCDGTCPRYWTQFGFSCYSVVKNKATWFEADEVCRDFRGYLAEINNAAEENFVIALLKNNASFPNVFWLGGSDLLHEGHWLWTTSQQPLTYTHWHTNEPNNNKGNENCMEISVAESSWNDNDCHNTFPFLCETETTDGGIVG